MTIKSDDWFVVSAQGIEQGPFKSFREAKMAQASTRMACYDVLSGDQVIDCFYDDECICVA